MGNQQIRVDRFLKFVKKYGLILAGMVLCCKLESFFGKFTIRISLLGQMNLSEFYSLEL